jgi:hypothetical protein
MSNELIMLIWILVVAICFACIYSIKHEPATYEIIWHTPEGKIIFNPTGHPSVNNGVCHFYIDGEPRTISGTFEVIKK